MKKIEKTVKDKFVATVGGGFGQRLKGEITRTKGLPSFKRQSHRGSQEEIKFENIIKKVEPSNHKLVTTIKYSSLPQSTDRRQ